MWFAARTWFDHVLYEGARLKCSEEILSGKEKAFKRRISVRVVHNIILRMILSCPFSHPQCHSIILLSSPLPNLIRPMQLIQKPQCSKVNHKLFMMQIMHLRRIIKEIVSTMNRRRFHEFKSEKEPIGEDMAFKDLRWNRDRKDVGEEVLEWMSVLSCERNGCGEAVVLLVDADVQSLGVE